MHLCWTCDWISTASVDDWEVAFDKTLNSLLKARRVCGALKQRVQPKHSRRHRGSVVQLETALRAGIDFARMGVAQ
jgi:hypothetical protein